MKKNRKKTKKKKKTVFCTKNIVHQYLMRNLLKKAKYLVFRVNKQSNPSNWLLLLNSVIV